MILDFRFIAVGVAILLYLKAWNFFIFFIYFFAYNGFFSMIYYYEIFKMEKKNYYVLFTRYARDLMFEYIFFDN